MWNAWGYNTECRPNHQVVKFLNAIICVPTVSCGYKIVPKNLEVRQYKTQTKQILGKTFFSLFPPRCCGAFLSARSGFPRGMSVCMVSQAAFLLPARCRWTWQRWQDLTLFAQCCEWRATNVFLPRCPSSSVFLSKIPIEALTLSLKGTYLLNLIHYAKRGAWLKIENH